MVRAVTYSSAHERRLSPVEMAVVADQRARLVARATGRVLELGGGLGDELGRYSPAVVAAVDVVGPDAVARPAIEKRAALARVPVGVIEAGTDLPDGTYDTVVSVLALCSADDQARELARLRAWLRPGGRLLFLDHVPTGRWRLTTQFVAPLWQSFADGCHIGRDLLSALRAAGFDIDEVRHLAPPALAFPFRSLAFGQAVVPVPR